jgi:hypothetical protein
LHTAHIPGLVAWNEGIPKLSIGAIDNELLLLKSLDLGAISAAIAVSVHRSCANKVNIKCQLHLELGGRNILNISI